MARAGLRCPKGLAVMRHSGWAWIWGWIVCALFAAGAARAQAYSSDLDAVLASPSPRLKLYAVMQLRPAGGEDLAEGLQRLLALRPQNRGGAQVISAGVSVSPELEYDANINAGTPGDALTIAGLVFSITPDSRAKAGFVAGAGAAGQLRLSLGLGRVVEFSASAGAARALDFDLTRSHYSLGLCGAQYLGGADWLDICATRRGGARALALSREDALSLGFARQFSAKRGFGEATLRLTRTDFGTFAKNALEFGLTRAAAQMGVVDGKIELGQRVDGQHTRLIGATVSLTRPMFGAQSTVFVTAAQEGGANFFGTDRRDQVMGVGISRPLGQRLRVTLSATRRTSTLDNYTGTTLGLNFTLPGLSF